MKHKWSYLAGLFDGEGTFTISNSPPKNGSPSYAFRDIFITNTNTEIMDWLKKEYGGSVRISRHGDKGWKDCYKWHSPAKDHKYLIRNMLPFLIIKRKQAQLVLSFIELKDKQNARQRGMKGLTQNERDARNNLLVQVRGLNKKAIPR